MYWMKDPVRRSAEVCFHPPHLRRTLAITIVVGTWLTLYNQGDMLLSAGLSTALSAKIVLNYLTPFLVSNWGLVSREANRA